MRYNPESDTMTEVEQFDENYYDYSQPENDNGGLYYNEHEDGCEWCEGGDRADEEEWKNSSNEDVENRRNHKQEENRKNVYWEDRDGAENQYRGRFVNGRKSVEVLCPHCNYYVNASVDTGAKWYMSLLSTILLPCCLCWLPRFTNGLTRPRHRCPICSRRIFVDRTSASGNRGKNYP